MPQPRRSRETKLAARKAASFLFLPTNSNCDSDSRHIAFCAKYCLTLSHFVRLYVHLVWTPILMPKTKSTSVFDFISLRKKLGFNQAEMANRMGLGSRAYFKLEQEPDSINIRHIMLARMVSLQQAVMNKDRSLAEKVISDLAIAYSQLPPTAWVVFHGRGRFMRAASTPSNGGQTMEIFKTEVEAKAAAKRWLRNGERVSAGTLIGNTTGRAIHPQEIEAWLEAD